MARVGRADPVGQPQPRRPTATSASNQNIGNGGPAPEKVTEAIHQQHGPSTSYRFEDAGATSTGAPHATALGGMSVEVIDPVTDYAELMQQLFDFDAMRAWSAAGHRMRLTPHERGRAAPTQILEGACSAPLPAA